MLEFLASAALMGLCLIVIACALTYLAIAIHDIRND